MTYEEVEQKIVDRITAIKERHPDTTISFDANGVLCYVKKRRPMWVAWWLGMLFNSITHDGKDPKCHGEVYELVDLLEEYEKAITDASILSH